MKEIYWTNVDYERSIEEAIGSGRYGGGPIYLINSKNFPSQRKGKARVGITFVKIYPVVGHPLFEGAVLNLKESNWRLAELRELLACHEQHKEADFQQPVLAMGSLFVDEEKCINAPCIFKTMMGYSLHLVEVSDVDMITGRELVAIVQSQ